MSNDPARWWDEPHPIVLTGGEMRVLWMGAVRYAMHRGTFASRETAESVERHIREIDAGTLQVIARDVEYEKGLGECRYFGHLPGLIDKELKRRESE